MSNKETTTPRVSRSGRLLKKTLKMKEMENLANMEDKEKSKSTNSKRNRDCGRRLSSRSRVRRRLSSCSSADDIDSSDDDEWNADDLSKESETGLVTRRRRREKAVGVACRRWVPKRRKLKKNSTTYSRNTVKTLSSRVPVAKTGRIMRIDRPPRRRTRLPLPRTEDSPEWTPRDVSPSRTVESLGTMPLGTMPLDVAAHLTLLGRHLSRFSEVVGRLGRVGPGVYSVLLDILLCSAGSLICLTRQVPGLDGRTVEDTCQKILDHIAYFMPCLEDDG